jgi:photosystem II stability/assembly factor-like uncharacterized protein
MVEAVHLGYGIWSWISTAEILNRGRMFRAALCIAIVGAVAIGAPAQAQNSWQIVHPYADGTAETREFLYAIHFQDSLSGTAVARFGTLNTTDGGVHWEYRGLDINKDSCEGLRSISYADSNHGWIAGLDGALFSTSNRGQSWERRALRREYDIEKVYFISKDVGFLLGDSSDVNNRYRKGLILRTTDAGMTWKKQTFLPSTQVGGPLYFCDIHFPEPMLGYAIDRTGELAKTTDGGITWNLIHKFFINKYAVYFTDRIRGFVTGDAGMMFETADGGESWVKIPRPGIGVDLDLTFLDDGKTGYTVGGVSPFIMKTNDSGRTWIPDAYSNPPIGEYLLAIHALDRNNIWIVGEDGLIVRSVEKSATEARSASNANSIDLHVFPNPVLAGTAVTCQVKIEHREHIILRMYDLQGRQIRILWQSDPAPGSYSVPVRLENLDAGIYWIELNTSSGNLRERMVVFAQH